MSIFHWANLAMVSTFESDMMSVVTGECVRVLLCVAIGKVRGAKKKKKKKGESQAERPGLNCVKKASLYKEK